MPMVFQVLNSLEAAEMKIVRVKKHLCCTQILDISIFSVPGF